MAEGASKPVAASPGTLPADPQPDALPPWQPLTPRGVAAFARAKPGRLILVLAAGAGLVAVALVWFLRTAWVPSVRTAIRRLPDQGALARGGLYLPATATNLLAEGPFLSIALDRPLLGRASAPADFRIVLQERRWQFCSLLGCWEFRYPAGAPIQFNRRELEPWWGAWEPVLLCLVALVTAGLLLLVWAILAAACCPVTRLAAFVMDRDLDWRGSWQMTAAALLPGALLMIVVLVGYGLGMLQLVGASLLAFLHLPVGWLYVGLGIWARPKVAPGTLRPANPFASSPSPPPKTSPDSGG